MTEPNSRPQPSAYFSLLKFMGAILIAVFLHYNDHFLPNLGIANPFEGNALLWNISHNSRILVEMFFLLSGILFAWVYKKRILAGEGFDSFFGKRILRIFPSVILTSIVMYLGNAVLYAYTGTLWSCGTLDLMELLIDSLFGGKPVFGAANTLNGPIWYINVLMLCYVLAYILTRSYKKHRSVFIYALPILLGLMIQYSGVEFLFWNARVARGLLAFFIGVFLGMFLTVYRDHFSPRSRRLFQLGGGMLLVAAVFVRTSPWFGLLVKSMSNFYAFLVFPCLIFICYDCQWLNRLCSTRLVRWMGNISFGIYLWDFPIYLGLHILIRSGHLPLDVTSAPFLIFVAVLHLVFATVSWYWIDVKLVQKLSKWFESSFRPCAVIK